MLGLSRKNPDVSMYYERDFGVYADVIGLTDIKATLGIIAKQINLLCDGFHGRPRLEIFGELSDMLLKTDEGDHRIEMFDKVDMKFLYHPSDEELVDWVKVGYFSEDFNFDFYRNERLEVEVDLEGEDKERIDVLRCDLLTLYQEDENPYNYLTPYLKAVIVTYVPDNLLADKTHVLNYQNLTERLVEERNKRVVERVPNALDTYKVEELSVTKEVKESEFYSDEVDFDIGRSDNLPIQTYLQDVTSLMDEKRDLFERLTNNEYVDNEPQEKEVEANDMVEKGVLYDDVVEINLADPDKSSTQPYLQAIERLANKNDDEAIEKEDDDFER